MRGEKRQNRKKRYEESEIERQRDRSKERKI